MIFSLNATPKSIHVNFPRGCSMHLEDDRKTLARVVDIVRGLSLGLLFIHIYCRCWSLMRDCALTSEVLDNILLHIETRIHPHLDNSWILHPVIILNLISSIASSKVPFRNSSLQRNILFSLIGLLIFYLSLAVFPLGERFQMGSRICQTGYMVLLVLGYILFWTFSTLLGRRLRNFTIRDYFNEENESFMQSTEKLENEYSVNLPFRFRYHNSVRNGWINVVNPFRATMVLGTPGSGKTYTVINEYIRQMICKGYALYIYDYKFDDLSKFAYNCLQKYSSNYSVKPEFCIINFDDPRHSHRCNPLAPEQMTDISDAYESAYTILLNLNRTWIQKQGDFFVESPIILLAAIIWFLKIYDNGRYCTFPHAIEFLNQPYGDVLNILSSYKELGNYLSPFMDAWKGGAKEQLQGQIASAKIPIARISSPYLYWVMTGNDFSLDINNPEHPKIVCLGNNPDRQSIYSAALGLFNSRIVRLINKKKKLKCGVIIDELPTIFFRGLDNLIATARSNKVAVCLGFQDFSQLTRDYGDKESRVIQNTVGNIFSGQVVADTARSLSERFGKILQKRESISQGAESTTYSSSTQMDVMIPSSKIANLSQGEFVGAVSDNFTEKISTKIFYGEISVQNENTANSIVHEEIPVFYNFSDEYGIDRMDEIIRQNYEQVKTDIKELFAREAEKEKEKV